VPQRSAHTPDLDREQLLSVRSVPEKRTGRVVVEVTGEVDTYTAPLLDACLRSQADRPGVRQVVVDLRGVTFLGAVGGSVIARAYRRCRASGARLTLRTDGNRTVERSLELTGLGDMVAGRTADALGASPTGLRTAPRPGCPQRRPSPAGAVHQRRSRPGTGGTRRADCRALPR
jgi:anti-anti-sigma factor